MIGEIKVTDGAWDVRFLIMADYVSTFSKDPRCRVGAVVVSPDRRKVSIGYNGFPVGTPDTHQDLADEEKREHLNMHAELNAILNPGMDMRGWTLYCTKFPCHVCAGAAANAKIARVVAPRPSRSSDWIKSHTYAHGILTDAGIEIAYVEEKDLGPQA